MALVDANSASYEMLDEVPGIGKAIIPRIIAGRPFRDMKDLRKRVKGVGDVKEKALSKYLYFGPHAASPRASGRSARSAIEANEQPSRQKSSQPRSSTPTPTSTLVDINNASMEELMTLHGIEKFKATHIIAARPFYSVDDLVGVKHIKKKVLDGFRDRVFVGEYCPRKAATRERSPSVSTLSTVTTTMAESLAREYVSPPVLYDYSDDDETSGDDYSDDDDDGADTRCSEAKTDDGDDVTYSESQPVGDDDAAFEEYLRQTREQSESAEFIFREWLEMEPHQTPSPAPFSVIAPPDSRFPVCRAVESRVREFVHSSQQQMADQASVDHRYRVWTPPEPRCRLPVVLVASWNVRNVSKNKSVCFLKKIAATINEFDLVALQEVRDEQVLIKLKFLLDPGWGFVMSDPVGQADGRQERYAFLYRKRVVEPTDTWDLETTADPGVLRPPFVVHFRSTPGSGLPRPLELTLVNVHVCFGHIRERYREIYAIRCMVDELAAQIPTERRNVVVLGDFNVPPVEALGGTDSALVALIRPPLATTVFGSLYDNIWIDPSAFHRPHDGIKVDACGVSRIDWRYYPLTRSVNESDAPRRSTALPEQVASERLRCAVELSDHCPVWAAFSTAPSTPTWAA